MNKISPMVSNASHRSDSHSTVQCCTCNRSLKSFNRRTQVAIAVILSILLLSGVVLAIAALSVSVSGNIVSTTGQVDILNVLHIQSSDVGINRATPQAQLDVCINSCMRHSSIV